MAGRSWLIVVAIGLIVSCIRIPVESWQIFGSILSDGSWEVLTTPSTEYYHPLWYLSINVGFLLLDSILGKLIPAVRDAADYGAMKELFRSIVSAAIWIPYMKISKRVRNTFVQ